jgi:CRP-like cAMP-binding protein
MDEVRTGNAMSEAASILQTPKWPRSCSSPDAQQIINLAVREITRERSSIDLRSASDLYLLLHGLACRYKRSPDGRHAITGFFLRGDVLDIDSLWLHPDDTQIIVLTRSKLAVLPRQAVLRLMERSPQTSLAIWRQSLAHHLIAKQWAINVGIRSALERTAHLLCEIFCRLQALGDVDGNTCEFPLHQSDLADALAITPVHLNRTLMYLRRTALITLRNRRLTIHDFSALQRLAGFDSDYLALEPSQGLRPVLHHTRHVVCSR